MLPVVGLIYSTLSSKSLAQINSISPRRTPLDKPARTGIVTHPPPAYVARHLVEHKQRRLDDLLRDKGVKQRKHWNVADVPTIKPLEAFRAVGSLQSPLSGTNAFGRYPARFHFGNPRTPSSGLS
jgi:hypothetical protein